MTFSSTPSFNTDNTCTCPSIEAGFITELDSTCRMTLPALTKAQEELGTCRADFWNGAAAEEFRTQLTTTTTTLTSLVSDVFTLLTTVA